MPKHALRRRTWVHGFLDGLMASWAVAFTVAVWTDRWQTAERVLAVLGLAACVTLIFVAWRNRWTG